MYSNKKIFFLFFFTMFITSCSNISDTEDQQPQSISKIDNIQWNLSYIETPSGVIMQDNYEPFKIVLWRNGIWGSDNCNFLSGLHLINNDTLNIYNGGITEMACPSLNVFSFDHLLKKPIVKKRGTKLILSKNDTTYVYTSDFTNDIMLQNFMNDTLTLKSSNDSDFAFFLSLGLFPELYLSSDRGYAIRWYNKLPGNTGFFNEHSGIFGINEKDEILFTKMRSYYEGNGISVDDRELVEGISNADSYYYDSNSLKIINTTRQTYYLFGK